MKKLMKRIGAVLMAVAMMAALGVTGAFAKEDTAHVITITNNDQNVAHAYEAYQIFVGKLNAAQDKLADIQWGSGVDGATLLSKLQASTDSSLMKDVNGTPTNVFAGLTTAAQVAEVLSGFQGTAGANQDSAAIDAVAKIIADSGALKASNKTPFTQSTDNAKVYTADVTGDGYYFIKDVTTQANLVNEQDKKSDTLSKYLLAVVKNTTIEAKDTGLTPDKNILGGTTKVKEDSAKVGDEKTFVVDIPVPNTKKYVKDFLFEMNDTLPVGMTFMGITSVQIAGTDVPAANYTLTVAEPNAAGTGYGNYGVYTAPADATAAVTTPGGEKIKLTFNNFKQYVETKSWANGTEDAIGKTLTIKYTAVVNEKADFTPTGNKNEVAFNYSNDPNHIYDGNNPDGPIGTTPKSITTTYLTNLVIYKVDDSNPEKKLKGATFEITSDDYNVALVKGDKYELTSYTLQTGETRADQLTYYKLTDGKYTTTAPTDATASSYASRTDTYQRIKFEKFVTKPGSTKKITAITDDAGEIKLEGIGPGTYKIKETIAPEDFNLDSTEYTIKIDFDTTEKKMVLNTTDSSPSVTFDNNTATAQIKIVNKSGSQLPSTGGIGTYVFTITGVAIMALAAGLLYIRHKKKAE